MYANQPTATSWPILHTIELNVKYCAVRKAVKEAKVPVYCIARSGYSRVHTSACVVTIIRTAMNCMVMAKAVIA